MPDDQMSLIYRGDGWNVQYAVARGARLAEGKGGDLWYTSDELATLEYLETFRSGRGLTSVHKRSSRSNEHDAERSHAQTRE